MHRSARPAAFVLGLGLLTVAALTPLPASATIINLEANMDCSQAASGNGTCGGGGQGTGTGTITFDDQTNLLSWTVQWSGLSGPATLAHFHGPATTSQSAGVQVGIGTTLPAVGSATLSAQQASDLLDELWYINVHTDLFPGGEIRGQVLVVSSTPEPALGALLVLGAAGLALRSLRKG